MNNQVLVIGATGNVGGALVNLLAAKGAAVKAATRSPKTYPAREGVTAVQFDYDDPATYAPALAGVKRVFAITKNADPVADTYINPFIDAAKGAGVEHFVLLTAMGVDQAGEELGYRRAELHLLGSGLDYTVLRPNWYMQNFTTGFVFPTIKHAGAIYVSAGDSKTSFIDTRDIAAVAALALTEEGHKGQEYTLTGPESLSYGEVAALISQATGREILYVSISDEALREALRDGGWDAGQIELTSALFAGVRQGWSSPVVPTVEALLGRAPTAFSDFIEQHAEVWQ